MDVQVELNGVCCWYIKYFKILCIVYVVSRFWINIVCSIVQKFYVMCIDINVQIVDWQVGNNI